MSTETPTLQPPPRRILFLVVGSALLLIVGTVIGLFTFQNVLRPGAVLPPGTHIYGLDAVLQHWNSSGPATITMALTYFGWLEDQLFAASFLKPDVEDRRVTPREIVQFVNERTDVRAVTRMGGNFDLIRAFIAGGFPVVISIGYDRPGYDWFEHYRAIVGYDDVLQRFYAYDTFLGTGENGDGIAIPYPELDGEWRHFNRNFIVLYEQEDEEQIAGILGGRSDLNRAAELSLEVAQLEAQTDPRDGFAWFNMGTALVALEQYEAAAVAYDRALQSGLPSRMLWYQFGPYEAYFNVTRYADVMALVDANLLNGGVYVEETYFWQGQVFAARGELENARAAFNDALDANVRYTAAQEALMALE